MARPLGCSSSLSLCCQMPDSCHPDLAGFGRGKHPSTLSTFGPLDLLLCLVGNSTSTCGLVSLVLLLSQHSLSLAVCFGFRSAVRASKCTCAFSLIIAGRLSWCPWTFCLCFCPSGSRGAQGTPPFPASHCGLGPNRSRGAQGTPLFPKICFVLLRLAFRRGHCLAVCRSKHVCALALIGQCLCSQCHSACGFVTLALMCSCRLLLLGQRVKGCPRCHAVGGVLDVIAPRAMAGTPWAPAA